MNRSALEPERIIGRYAVFSKIAAGGMATVHFGRLIGPAGFARIVAIKRLHPHLARDPEFVSMFLDEARLAARIRHPNVVSTLDVVALERELFIVMDYIEGESLSRLRRLANDRDSVLPIPIAIAILVNVLHGLHAAHEAVGESGVPLSLIHRDVSPHNILVGVDGVARIVDFGVAKAAGRLQGTRDGVVKGKIAYMAPEQVQSRPLDRRVDIYAASVVLWELLTGQRLFTGINDFAIAEAVITKGVEKPPSRFNASVSTELDQIVMRATARSASDRFATALEMADELERAVHIASARSVGRVVQELARHELDRRSKRISELEGAVMDAETKVSAIEPPARTTELLPASPPEEENDDRSLSAQPPTRPIPSPLGTIPLPSAPEADAPALPITISEAKVGFAASAAPRARWQLASVVGAGLLLTGLLVIAVVVSISRSHAARGSAETPITAVESGSPARVLMPEVDTPAPAPIASESAPVSTSSAPPSPRHAPKPTSSKTIVSTAPQPSCDPPFYIDERGRKVFKEGCLK